MAAADGKNLADVPEGVLSYRPARSSAAREPPSATSRSARRRVSLASRPQWIAHQSRVMTRRVPLLAHAAASSDPPKLPMAQHALLHAEARSSHAPRGDTSPSRLQSFIAGLTSLVDRKADEATMLAEGGEMLRELIAHDDWLPDSHARPDAQRYQQFLLYADPQDRFFVVSFVWGPGQSTPIHDHTVWGIVGMLHGREGAQRYVRDAAGQAG